jgi:thymidylate synthase (FAD)
MTETTRNHVAIFAPPYRPIIYQDAQPVSGPLVTPVDWPAGDRAIAQYFWTSTEKDADAWTCDEAEVRRVISFGMKAQPVPHGTPTGHGHLTVLVERIPIPIAEQMLRHRVQEQTPDGDSTFYVEWAPNISKKSMRYVDAQPKNAGETVDLADVYYVPEQWLSQTGRPGAYTYVPLDPEKSAFATTALTDAYIASWGAYRYLRDTIGASAEQARFALCLGLYTRLYATASLRNWFNYLVQRDDSHAQSEHRQIARQVDDIMQQIAPITYELWTQNGRRVI